MPQMTSMPGYEQRPMRVSTEHGDSPAIMQLAIAVASAKSTHMLKSMVPEVPPRVYSRATVPLPAPVKKSPDRVTDAPSKEKPAFDIALATELVSMRVRVPQSEQSLP